MAYDGAKPASGGSLSSADIRENFRALKDDDIVTAYPSLITSYKGLKITTVGAANNQSVLITADKVIAVNTSNKIRLLSSVSLTVNLANSGANGLDAGSLAANAGYYLYIIYNGSTVAGLASTSATAPTMPSGYTFKALVGWCTSDATTTPFNIEEFTQYDDVFVWAAKQKVVDNGGGTTTLAVNMAAGGALSYAVCPPDIAKLIFSKVLANNTCYFHMNPVTFSNDIASDNAESFYYDYWIGGEGGSPVIPVHENQKFYYQTRGAGTTVDIWITGFNFRI